MVTGQTTSWPGQSGTAASLIRDGRGRLASWFVCDPQTLAVVRCRTARGDGCRGGGGQATSCSLPPPRGRRRLCGEDDVVELVAVTVGPGSRRRNGRVDQFRSRQPPPAARVPSGWRGTEGPCSRLPSPSSANPTIIYALTYPVRRFQPHAAQALHASRPSIFSSSPILPPGPHNASARLASFSRPDVSRFLSVLLSPPSFLPPLFSPATPPS